MISMMGAHTAGAGKTEKPTVTVCALAPRVRENTQEPGNTVSRPAEFTPGPAETATKANGCRANAMVSASRTKVTGCTEGSGPKDSRDVMGSAKARHQAQSTKEPGPLDYKMDTVWKHTQMEVRN